MRVPFSDELKRELNLVDLLALGINGVIGTGIFVLPGDVALRLGPASVLSFLVAALLCTLLVLCFAEVGSRFDRTGGPMLYSQAAFGDWAGYFVGWITWVNRVIAWAALANALIRTIDALWPGAGVFKAEILTVLFASLTLANVLGVNAAAKLTNLLTAVKLLPIAVFLAVGLFHLSPANFTPFAPHGFRPLAESTLLIFYAFTGFEVLTVPAGEMRNPQGTLHRALMLTMAIVTAIYLLIWLVCTGSLATLAGSENPVADAATGFLGDVGGKLIAAGIFLSVLGINSASALVSPRSLYALASEGYLPRGIGSIYRRTQTPIVAILITTLLAYLLALKGSFVQLVVVSVIARFAQYIPTCLAVPMLRIKDRRDKGQPAEGGNEALAAAAFSLPGGASVPTLAVAISVWLLWSQLAKSTMAQLLWGVAVLVVGLLIYLPQRLRQAE